MARGNLEQHEIFLSGLRVRVQSCCTRTNRYLQRHWSAAKLPMLPTETSCDIEVIADASPRIVVDGDVVWAGGVVEDLVSGFEQWLYRAALAQHEGRLEVFHAAALVSDGATFVFSGPSGAGKSSLALAAVRHGWKYFSDEFVVTDGERVWGWPRAIRFDPTERGTPCPDYLVELDTDPDAMESPQDVAPPYYAVSGNALQRVACSAREVHFVSVERGPDTTLSNVSTAVGLKYWTEAAFFGPTMSLGALVGAGRTWRASWRHPEELIDLIATT